MHILIHEPNHGGHRLTTVRVLIQSLLEVKEELERSNLPSRISSVTLATTASAQQCDAFRVQLAPLSKEFEIRLVPEIGEAGDTFKRSFLRLQGLRKTLKEKSYDHVYLPYSDGLLQLLTLSRLVPGASILKPTATNEALIMQSSYAYPNAATHRRIRASLTARFCNCDRLHLNDPLAWNYLQQSKRRGMEHACLIPDPITDTQPYEKSQARQALELPDDGRIVGTVGVINARKGADVLVKAFTRTNLEPTDRLLLAGKFTADMVKLVQDANDERILCLDRYLSEEELAQALSAMDLVATPYPPVIGSASIVIRAAVAGRMVLASDTGWTGYIVPTFGLGATASVTDIDAFARALETALSKAADYIPGPEAMKFAEFNQESNVQAHWSALIRQKTGLEPHPAFVAWPDIQSLPPAT